MNLDRLKRDARSEAWKDPLNPFSKYQGQSSRQNTLNNAERGESRTGLAKIQTDDLGQQSPGAQARRQDLRGASPPPPKHAQTLPNVSPTAANHPDRDQEAIPRSTSPIQEEHTDKISQNAVGEHGKDSPSSETAREDDETEHSHSHGKGLSEKFNNLIHRKSHPDSDSDQQRESDDMDNGKAKGPNFTFKSQIRATILNSWINILLIASPVGIAVYYAKINPVAVFVINFIAIIPLAGLLSYATEEIALRVGETLGGLLNASFGNAVELIVSIIALIQRQTLIVQTSLIGSILSNLLLVMGMCFFFGGINRIEQAFNMTVAQTAASLLFLAVSALIIPTAFDQWASGGQASQDSKIRQLSRGTAVMLLIVYGCYLFFQLKSHADMYNAPSEKNPKREVGKRTKRLKNRYRKHRGKPSVEQEIANREANVNDEAEQPQLHIWVAIATLAGSTVLVALNAEYLVDSINEVTCDGGINKNFVGLILLPIVGNAAEHATAVTVAVKDKMDLAIGVAVGSSMQIALLVLPFTVVLGWIIDRPGMTLDFDGFQIAILFVAVLLVNYLIQDGKSHWLEGVLLQTLYIIIAVAAW